MSGKELMNKAVENQCPPSTLEKVNGEVRSIYGDLMDDIISGRSSLHVVSCLPMPCSEVGEIFDIKTNFEMTFSTSWAPRTIGNINAGISGLILDELEKDNIFSQIMFEKFFELLNHLLTNNKKLKDILVKHSMEEITRKYKNKYKLVKVIEIFSNFVGREDGNSVPNICMELQVERN